MGKMGLESWSFYEALAPAGFIQPTKRTEFTAAPAEGLTSSGPKCPRYCLSQEGVAFHQEPDLRWNRKEVKMLWDFAAITIDTWGGKKVWSYLTQKKVRKSSLEKN